MSVQTLHFLNFVNMWIKSWNIKKKRPPLPLRYLPVLPILFLAVISLCSIWTGWVFSVSPDTNIRTHGPLHLVEPLVTYTFFVASAILLVVTIARRRFARGEIHVRALSISLILLYIEMQTKQISQDGLTGINNRRSFDNYLSMLFREDRKDGLFLMMCDVDLFKTINDRYGHIEGDEALCTTARILKEQCHHHGGRGVYLSRYGGDEFAIVCSLETDESMLQLKQNLEAAFRAYNDSKEKPYKLQLSIGLAKTEPGMQDMRALIMKADAALYEEKKQHHQAAR